MKYIDTHAHIVSSYLKEDLETILLKAKENNITHILVPGTNLNDSLEALELSKKHKNIIAGFGIHPSDTSDKITDSLDNQNFEGFSFIGETGIDLYHESNPSLEVQQRSFIKHLEIAKKLDLPIEVHTRNSFKETYQIMKNYKGLKFIMHSFTGDLEWGKKFIELGAYISFSGIVTFKNAKEVQNTMLNIPLDKILIETDSPFLTPVPHRGKTNNPSYVKHVGDFIKDNRIEENVLETIYNNTLKLFNLK